MDIKQILTQLGLTSQEASLYIASLELGESLVLPLAKQAGFSRTVAYRILPRLHERGLISYGSRGKRQTIIGENPLLLLETQEAHLKEIRQILPRFLSEMKRSQPGMLVRTYEGVEGIKQVYEDTLRDEFPIASFLDVSHIHPDVQHYLLTSYVPRRVRRGIRVKNLVSGSLKSSDGVIPEKGSHRDNRFIDPKSYPAPMELLLYGNKSAFITYNNQQPKAVVIESGEIAQSLRSLHKIAWTILTPTVQTEEE